MINVKDAIKNGKTALGIEFGSTNIKGVLVDENGSVLATGSFGWENSLIDGIWTYSQDEILPDGLYCILVYSDYTESVMGYEFHVHTTGGS